MTDLRTHTDLCKLSGGIYNNSSQLHPRIVACTAARTEYVLAELCVISNLTSIIMLCECYTYLPILHIYLSVYTSTPSQQTIPWVQHTLRHIHSLPHMHLLPPIPYLSLPCSVSGGTGNIEGTNLVCDTSGDCTFNTATASAGCTHSKDLVIQCSKLYTHICVCMIMIYYLSVR